MHPDQTDPITARQRITPVTHTLRASRNPTRDPRTALTSDQASLGLARSVVETSLGGVVVRAGARAGDTATIFVHGAAGSWTTWTPLLRAAREAGEPVPNVVAVDLPGWGESDIVTDGLDVAQLSLAVREVAEALGYRRWIVVGHSLGGLLALDIAARTPDATDAVLLISPSGPAVIDAVRRPLRGGAALPWFAGMLLAMRMLSGLRAVGEATVPALNRIGLLRVLSSPLFASPRSMHDTVIDAVAAEIRPRAFVDAARAAARYDETIWRAVTCPVVALRGEQDVFMRDSDEAVLTELVQNITYRRIGAAGHFAALERPELVWEALRSLSRAQ